MLNRVRKAICICLIVFGSVIFGSANCVAYTDVSEMYQERLWISLDIPKEQRDQIDDIIVEANNQVGSIQRTKEIDNLYDFEELYKLSSYLKQMYDIRMSTNSKIAQLLIGKQKSIFESQLQESQKLKEKSMVMILEADLPEVEQTIIINSLLKSQQQVWVIISDKSLSWEERRKKLKSINSLELNKNGLTHKQIVALKTWNRSVNITNI